MGERKKKKERKYRKTSNSKAPSLIRGSRPPIPFSRDEKRVKDETKRVHAFCPNDKKNTGNSHVFIRIFNTTYEKMIHRRIYERSCYHYLLTPAGSLGYINYPLLRH